MSATLKMKKWRDNFLQIPEGLRGHPMSELEEVASTLTAIVNMTDDSHIQDMAKFCITEVIAADKEIAARDAELARLRGAINESIGDAVSIVNMSKDENVRIKAAVLADHLIALTNPPDL